jgi:hypothetical protein
MYEHTISSKKKQIRNRDGMKQICFDVPEEWHGDLIKRVRGQNMTMKQWIMRSCIAQIKKEKSLGWE